MKMKLLGLALSIFILACTDDDKEDDTPTPGEQNLPEAIGMDVTQSSSTFEDTYTALKSAIDANPNITIVAEVDHMANAESAGLTLDPTRIIFFGNPNLGTPLMQANQLAGLDLPQKIVVLENDNEEVYLGFNNSRYLAARHDVENVETLSTIQAALSNFLQNVGQTTLTEASTNEVSLGEGVITKMVNGDATTAYNRLRMAIENNENLKIIAELDHQANAANVDLELNPTRIIIFGNPNLGTPLMQDEQTIALDLPQKMLIWTDDDEVTYVSYNDPAFFVKRHGLTDSEGVLETITGALDNLSNVAVGSNQ